MRNKTRQFRGLETVAASASVELQLCAVIFLILPCIASSTSVTGFESHKQKL